MAWRRRNRASGDLRLVIPPANGTAGAGIKPRTTLGATDDFGYFITAGKRTCQGLQQRLIGPEGDAMVRREILA